MSIQNETYLLLTSQREKNLPPYLLMSFSCLNKKKKDRSR